MFSCLLYRTETRGSISQNSFSSNFAGRFGGAIYDVNVTGEPTQPSMTCCTCVTSYQCLPLVCRLVCSASACAVIQEMLPDLGLTQALFSPVQCCRCWNHSPLAVTDNQDKLLLSLVCAVQLYCSPCYFYITMTLKQSIICFLWFQSSSWEPLSSPAPPVPPVSPASGSAALLL